MPGYPVDTVGNSQPWNDPGGLVRNPTGSNFVDLSTDYADPNGGSLPVNPALAAFIQAGQLSFDGRGVAQGTTPATFRIFPSTSGPASPVSYSGNFIAGVVFGTSNGGFLDGYWWWVCASGQSTSPTKCALWLPLTSGGSASLVAGSVVTSGTLTAGQWNYIPLSTPVQLAPGTEYIAAVGVNGNFPDTSGFWGSGGPGYNGITNGILTAYGNNTGTGPPLFGQQAVFSTAGTDPAVTFPSTVNSDNFWVDVQVDNTPSFTGVYRLWPTLTGALADNSTQLDNAVDYVLATEVLVYQTCTVGKIWFYSPSGTAQLPTDVNIWTVDRAGVTGSSVYHGGSPTWSGAAGTGWISTTLTGVTLSPGDYKISVYNSAGTPDQWSAKRLNYWGGTNPVAPNGIAIGPLLAPSPSTPASTANSYNPTAGTPTEPGQSTFAATGTNVYPTLYGGAFSPGGDLYQNYWVDAEFTPVAGGVTTGGTGAITFGGSAAATVTVAATGTGAIVFAGSGTARVAVNGTGTGAIVFAGSGTATTGTVANGTGTGAIVFAGSGTATSASPGTGTGNITFGGSAAATVTVAATGTGAIVFAGSGTAVSHTTVTASGTGAIVFAGQGVPGRFDTVGSLTAAVAATSTVGAAATAAQTALTGAVAAQNVNTGSGA